MALQDPYPCEPAVTETAANKMLVENEFVLSGCLTVDDAMAAHRLATHGFLPRLILLISTIAVFSIVLIAVAVSSRPYSPRASNIMLMVACVILPGLLVMPHVVGRIRLHRFARRQYGMFAPTHSIFSNANIVATSDNVNAEFTWPLFSHFVANDSVALLFHKNSKQYLILARSKLHSPENWDAFLNLVRSKLADNNGTEHD